MVVSSPSRREDAVAELVQRQHAGLRSYLRWLGADPAAVEDLVQDTFVVALSRPFEQRHAAATAAWLRTVARNLLLRTRRSAARFGRLVELDDVAAAWEQHLGADDGDTLRAALRACVGELRGRQGDAVRLRYGEGLSVAAVAARLGLGAAGAETLLRRLRTGLRACIERRLQQ